MYVTMYMYVCRELKVKLILVYLTFVPWEYTLFKINNMADESFEKCCELITCDEVAPIMYTFCLCELIISVKNYLIFKQKYQELIINCYHKKIYISYIICFEFYSFSVKIARRLDV